ncbi:MAG: protease modulator HflC [Alphaproteobacteria bacterium]
MTQSRLIILGALAFLGYLLVQSSFFVVHQTQQALVLQFGNPVRVVQEPGLNVKIPLIQDVELQERRILNFDAPAEEIVAGDQRRLVVDAFARWRITDPLQFYQAVRTEAVALQRLETLIDASLRESVGGRKSDDVVSGARSEMMQAIAESVNVKATDYGIEIVDVRLRRVDLPQSNSEAIYRRMQAEREREAREARAEGAEDAQRARADADRQVTVLLAEAEKTSQILRGEGDQERNRIFAEAYGKDKEFFDFYRSMQAYREALSKDGTSMVLSPDSEFFRFFGDEKGR